jgi:hypothetical protein
VAGEAQLHQGAGAALVAQYQFAGQQLLQEVGEAGFIAGGVLRQRRPVRAQVGQLELPAQLGDALVLQAQPPPAVRRRPTAGAAGSPPARPPSCVARLTTGATHRPSRPPPASLVIG